MKTYVLIDNGTITKKGAFETPPEGWIEWKKLPIPSFNPDTHKIEKKEYLDGEFWVVEFEAVEKPKELLEREKEIQEQETQGQSIEFIKTLYKKYRKDVSIEASNQFVSAFVEFKELGTVDPKDFPLMDDQIEAWKQEGKFS